MRPAFFVAVVITAALLAACSPRFDLREVRGPPGSFIAALPGRPQASSREIVLTVDGAAVRAEMAMLSSGIDASLFAVGTAQLPAEALVSSQAIQQTLAGFREGLARNIGAAAPAANEIAAPAGLGKRRLRAAQAFEVAGSAGSSGRAARLAARIYVVDDRLYQLVVIGADDEVPAPVLETFFDSFRLQEQAR